MEYELKKLDNKIDFARKLLIVFSFLAAISAFTCLVVSGMLMLDIAKIGSAEAISQYRVNEARQSIACFAFATAFSIFSIASYIRITNVENLREVLICSADSQVQHQASVSVAA